MSLWFVVSSLKPSVFVVALIRIRILTVPLHWSHQCDCAANVGLDKALD